MAGATVFRGIRGFGLSNRIHASKILRLSEDVPIIIEILEKQTRTNQLLPFLENNVKESLMLLSQ
jgi:PII-like signaling protein